MAIVLHSHSTSITLDILQYEFPEDVSEYDANWLVVSFQLPTIEKPILSACLLTWELVWLIQWFRDALENDPETMESFLVLDCSFEIGYLRIEGNERHFYLRVNKRLSTILQELDSFSLDFCFSLDIAGHTRIIRELLSFSKAFPPRGVAAESKARQTIDGTNTT